MLDLKKYWFMLNGFSVGWQWLVGKRTAENTDINFQPTFVFEKKKDFTMPICV
jgi:hypothetical protein